MEITGVPKSFWHASSFCIVTLTISFMVFSFKSGELNIKFNQLEIKASQTLALQQTVERQKQNLENQRTLIEERSKILSDVEDKISAKINELKKIEEDLENFKGDVSAVNNDRLKDFYAHVKKVSEAANRLDDKQEELKTIQSQESLYLDLYNRDNKLYERQKILQGYESDNGFLRGLLEKNKLEEQ